MKWATSRSRPAAKRRSSQAGPSRSSRKSTRAAAVHQPTHGGFAIMIPLIVATVTATVIARQIDGYSIYSARLRAKPGPASAAPPASSTCSRSELG